MNLKETVDKGERVLALGVLNPKILGEEYEAERWIREDGSLGGHIFKKKK